MTWCHNSGVIQWCWFVVPIGGGFHWAVWSEFPSSQGPQPTCSWNFFHNQVRKLGTCLVSPWKASPVWNDQGSFGTWRDQCRETSNQIWKPANTKTFKQNRKYFTKINDFIKNQESENTKIPLKLLTSSNQAIMCLLHSGRSCKKIDENCFLIIK